MPNSRAATKFLFGSCNLHSLGVLWNPDKAYERLAEEAAGIGADFMIHCGDQIYYDVPTASAPSLEAYRAKYLDAWSDSRQTRRFLTRLPHYMILDDHEIIDNFANDMELSGPAPLDAYKTTAIKVYREFQYIHSPRNHGNDALHYEFAHGRNQFFVLDARSERHRKAELMVSPGQMRIFKRWLVTHADAVKFVVTSVPFVAESPRSEDKWSHFRRQREEIIEHLAKHEIGRLVFLCGDQHNSHHAQLEIDSPERSIVLHELMASPINQIFKTSFSEYRSGVPHTTPAGIRYRSTLRRTEFYNAHSNAMAVRVEGGRVSYRVFRTKSNRGGMRKKSFLV